MRKARVLTDLLDGDDEFACLHDRARVDRRTLVLHGRVRLARNGCLIDGGIAADDAAIDDDLLTSVRGDDVARLDLFDRHFALHLTVDQPDVALVEGQQAGDLRAGALCCVAREHLGTVGDGQQRQARFRLAGEHRGNDGRGRQRISVRTVVLDHALDAVLNKLARNREHKQAARDFHAEEELRRGALQDLHAGKAGQREERITPVLRQALGRRHSRFLCAPHSCDSQSLDLTERQCAPIPDLDALVCDRHRFDRAVAADLRGQQRAFFTRQCGLQMKVTTSIHHTVRHPLINDSAHQSICAPDGEEYVMSTLRIPRRAKSSDTSELISNQPAV